MSGNETQIKEWSPTRHAVRWPSLYDHALDTDSCGVGLVADTRGGASRRVLDIALTSLANVAHRGGIGANPTDADGAGILTDPPRRLIAQWLGNLNVESDISRIAVAMLFLPQDDARRDACLSQLAHEVAQVGLVVLGERSVPTNLAVTGDESASDNRAQKCGASHVPAIKQLFIQAPPQLDVEVFEQKLYLVSRRIARWAFEQQQHDFSVVSMSSRVLIYKGLVSARQLADFYPDLREPDYECRFCIYHQRFSTNTTPQWELCQPFPMLAHNGEINTIRGNRNWMNARQPTLRHANWGDEIADLFPITSHHESDSASLSNALQLLRHSGRDLLQAMSILVPPAWHGSTRLTKAELDYFDFQSCFSEPWDGPAALAFTDGEFVAACLDRNGLRPARYKITEDGLFILGSEAGADRHPNDRTQASGRLRPGEMIAVDIRSGEIHFDREIKSRLAARHPYGQWLRENRLLLAPQDASTLSSEPAEDVEILIRRQIAAGLTVEDRGIVIGAMVESGKEATVSMGLDTPLAILSRRPQLLSRYFKQRFAQVTNPPIDSIREKNVMSVSVGIGPERNLLDETPEHCKIIALEHPILFEPDLRRLMKIADFPSQTVSCLYDRARGGTLRAAIDRVCGAAERAANAGAQIIVLSDRAMDRDHVGIPILMAAGAVHHRLCSAGLRMNCSLIADTSSVWDPHDFALLFGYGTTAVCPYLALRTAASLEIQPADVALRNYRTAIEDGLRKIMAKMGISVLNSYQGAQIFETIGVDADVVDLCFRGTKTTIEGAGFDVFQRDYELLHGAAFDSENPSLAHEGRYKPKKSGVRHLINGRVTKALHQFVRDGQQKNYDAFAAQVQPDDPYALRDLLTFETSGVESIELNDVEAISAIQKRFTTAAMSLGAISPEAHEAIALAMNQIGGKSNSGEGGEDARRHLPDALGRDARSRIKQIASGRFGVTTDYLISADEIEIKMAQGAKPGEGGQLHGFKVNEMIARLRHTDVGVPLISPPPHHDIYSIEDLAQLIHDLKCVNPHAGVCVKLVAKSGVGNIAVGVAKANADVILISGHDGGTGASPLSSINHAGIPWELGLAETHHALVANKMRERVIVRADGGIKTGRDVIIAAMLGADEFSFGTMALISLGCVYVKKCHLNNCPVGIATQDEKFRKRFQGEPEHLVRYFNGVADDVRRHLSLLGKVRLNEIVGQTQLLKQKQLANHAKANRVCLRRLLAKTDWNAPARKKCKPRPITCFDDALVGEVLEGIANGERVVLERTVVNTDRNIGSRLAGVLSEARFAQAEIEDLELPNETLTLNLTGSAGQSLGAFLIDGIVINLQGEANDYVAKSMAGGTITIRPPAGLQSASQDQALIGSTCLYGATGGRLFVAGHAAERFAIRNSGAVAVIEGCGDHGCEYMTRGTVAILGTTGQNLGAGMTGGKVFVYDADNRLHQRLNHTSVVATSLTEDDQAELEQLVRQHATFTGSKIATLWLTNWQQAVLQFRKVFGHSNRHSLRRS